MSGASLSAPQRKPPSGLKSLGSWTLALAAIWGFHFLFTSQLNAYYLTVLIYAGINIVLAVSLNLVNGFTGQFSMGHAGFMAVGGYVSAYLTTSLQANHSDWIAHPVIGPAIFIGSLLLGGIAATFAGYIVGLPSLRLRGDYLAIVTLGFGEIIRILILNIDAVGGARGMPGIYPFSNFGIVYSAALLTTFTVWRLVRSSFGRGFLAVREDEIAAEAMGVHTTRAKARAFAIGAFFAGVAGGLFGHQLQYLAPQNFDFNRSFEVIIMVVLGGMGSITGSVIAALFLTIIREALRPLQELTHLDFRMIIYSLLLIVLMLTRPNGLLGTREWTAFLPPALRKKLKLSSPGEVLP